VLVPGAGAWVAALEATSGRSLDVVVGKPSATILLEAAAALGCAPAECLYVGDNVDVDVAGAHTAGMDALLVRTGVSQAGGEGLLAPEHILDSVADLAGLFAESESDSRSPGLR
jgi:ribonucleotide monophosphatase NagD (HAD superfamily)